MTKAPPPSEKAPGRGYGNIYTPHAGSMIIHVQRESGLANRTIILTQRQVRLLRRGAYILGTLLVIVLVSWFFLAVQAARVPQLTLRVQHLQRDVTRLDTLQTALTALESRFQQVQHMLGASSSSPASASAAAPPPTSSSKAAGAATTDAALAPANASAAQSAAIDTGTASMPSQWPLDVAGTIVSHDDSTTAISGLDIEVPAGTLVRAAGTGSIVDVSVDSTGAASIRIAHRDGYESIYGGTRNVRVAKGARITAGTVIAVSGGATGSLPPHIHFEVRHNGTSVDPMSLMKRGPSNGDLQ